MYISIYLILVASVLARGGPALVVVVLLLLILIIILLLINGLIIVVIIIRRPRRSRGHQPVTTVCRPPLVPPGRHHFRSKWSAIRWDRTASGRHPLESYRLRGSPRASLPMALPPPRGSFCRFRIGGIAKSVKNNQMSRDVLHFPKWSF